jgi:hypothetical protein
MTGVTSVWSLVTCTPSAAVPTIVIHTSSQFPSRAGSCLLLLRDKKQVIFHACTLRARVKFFSELKKKNQKTNGKRRKRKVGEWPTPLGLGDNATYIASAPCEHQRRSHCCSPAARILLRP